MKRLLTSTLAENERSLKPIAALFIIGGDLCCMWALYQGFQSASPFVWIPCAFVALVLCLLSTWGLFGPGAAIGGIPSTIFALAPAVLPAALSSEAGSAVQTTSTALYFLSCAFIAYFAVWFRLLRRTYIETAPIASDAVLVVLGGYIVSGKPVRTIRKRLAVAAHLWNESPDRIIVVTGGPTHDGSTTEGEAMARWLMYEYQIPPDAILEEREATTTEENIKLAQRLLQDYALSTRQMCIVSSDYHLYRSLRIARRLGIDATCAAASVPPRTRLQQWCREVLLLSRDMMTQDRH